MVEPTSFVSLAAGTDAMEKEVGNQGETENLNYECSRKKQVPAFPGAAAVDL